MSKIVDLSLDIYDKAPTMAVDPKTAVIEHLHIKDLKYNITQLVMSTHFGTHLDAPFHFFDKGITVDKLDLSKGFGPAWVLDFSAKGPKAEITREDLMRHDRLIVKGARLIIRTGWDRVFPEDEYFPIFPAFGQKPAPFSRSGKLRAWLRTAGGLRPRLRRSTSRPAWRGSAHRRGSRAP